MESHNMQAHIKTYYKVWAALIVLSVITVAVSYIETHIYIAVLIGLFIASIKAGLVARIFMHLSDEKKVVTWSLWLTAIFFVVLMILPLVTDIEMVRYNARFAP